MSQHIDRYRIAGDNQQYRNNYDKIFKKFRWIKTAKIKGEIKSDACPIDQRMVVIGNLLTPPLPIRCRESIFGKCAYCGDVETRNDTERAIQCFYPVAQNDKLWHPEIKCQNKEGKK